MYCGVGKSGSPAPRSMISRPAARRAFARVETAIVGDALSSAILGERTNSVTMATLRATSIRDYTLRRPAHARARTVAGHSGGIGGTGRKGSRAGQPQPERRFRGAARLGIDRVLPGPARGA